MDVDQNFMMDLTVLALVVLGVLVGMLKMRDVMYGLRRWTRRRHENEMRASRDRQQIAA
ncbi:MAG: hypothetical protein JSR45_11010 [Proteobacteria bacterium]|nr:hypothetical protein [Pseudomonadota bacterium]